METVEELMAKVQEHQDRVFEIQRSIERLEVTGVAGNGDVVVKLRGTGQLTDVTIDDRMLRQGAEAIGMLVVQAVNDGLKKLAETTRRRFEPLSAELQE
jgi:DNA-binding YbaB/EbfC family protein